MPQYRVENMTAAEIAKRASERRRESIADRAAKADAVRAAGDSRARVMQQVGAARAELAFDLKCTVELLPDAVGSLVRRQSEPSVAPILADLASLLHTPAEVAMEAVILSRHVLHIAKVLPPVRKDDAAFHSPSAVGSLRHLPPTASRAITVVDHHWFERLAKQLDIVEPRSFVDRPSPDEASYQEKRAEIYDNLRSGFYDDNQIRNHQMAGRALELLDRERLEEVEAARRHHDRRSRELRAAIIATLDDVLVELPIGVPFWWTRELRRHIGSETPRVDDVRRVLVIMGGLGIRLPTDKVRAVS